MAIPRPTAVVDELALGSVHPEASTPSRRVSSARISSQLPPVGETSPSCSTLRNRNS